ncbi:MAG: hypothetical protein U0746_18435 [Gemmataceae bacterium]
MAHERAAHQDRDASTPSLYRHGDVLVAAVGGIPSQAVRRPHLVLAEGEVTGHMHRIAEPGSAELYQDRGQTYLRVVADSATLVHPEHGPIALPRGDYRVWRQREYSPRAIQFVRD